jgi:hypothetical protein
MEDEMTDDLIKRLRDENVTGFNLTVAAVEAAERIEELERELEIRGGVLELHRIRVAELEGAERQRDEMMAALLRVQNFPSHPGSHKDDRSSEADCPESWRHGWICAVEAIQDHAIPNSSAIDTAIAAARKE